MPLQTPADELSGYLEPGERLSWSDRPKPGIRFRPHDAFLIPFSMLWCGFAIFWELGALRSGAPLFFALWGIPFVAVGLYIVFGRFVADAATRRKTVYGLTDRRALILGGLFSRELRSLNLDAIPEISLKLHADGAGTITFGTPSMPLGHFPGWPGSSKATPPSFEFIDGAQQVYSQIMQRQRTAESITR